MAVTMLATQGWPDALAARGVLSAKVRKQVLKFLAPLEAFVRRLLLLEALRAPPPACAFARAPRKKRRVQKSAIPRAVARAPSFRLFGAAAGPRRRRLTRYVLTDAGAFCPAPSARPETFPAAPIVRRMAALLGVLEDRAPHVARMARAITRAPVRARASFTRQRFPFLRGFAVPLMRLQPSVDRALARLPSPQALSLWDSS